jgi:hypothetical protein
MSIRYARQDALILRQPLADANAVDADGVEAERVAVGAAAHLDRP